MRSIDSGFYHSKEWRQCRAWYIGQHPICERCAKEGKVVPSKFVHHVIELTPINVNDPELAFGENNLEALCFDCHEKQHGRKRKKRWRVSPDGTVRISDPPKKNPEGPAPR